jgi:shikimate kinase
MVVTLIGYRGCGKSSVGRMLAERWGWECADADEEIERAAGMTIRQVFEQRGEAAFRDLEEEAIARLLQRDKLVLAAGGGAVLRESTRDRMRAAGPVVWLTASPEILFERIRRDPSTDGRRPNLTSAGGLDEIRDLLAQRESIYRAASDACIDTDPLTPGEIADRLAEILKGSAPRREEPGS